MDAATIQPEPNHQRLVNIDMIRGIAVLGILLMNIQSFALIEAAYVNPTALGELDFSNYLTYYIIHLFADQKFITIFSILFGTSMALMAQKQHTNVILANQLHYRRMKILAVIGLSHFILFWQGDILFYYAISGMIAYQFINKPAKSLILLGMGLITITWLIELNFDSVLVDLSPSELNELNALWAPSAEQIAAEHTVMHSSWFVIFVDRLAIFTDYIAGLFVYGFITVGLMLIGIALFKLRFFSHAIQPTTLLFVSSIALVIGLILSAYGVEQNVQQAWPLTLMFSNRTYNNVASLLIAFSYLGFLVWFCQSTILTLVKKLIANVGRMALTNYLAQTLLCTTLFYGGGLGLFGQFDRVELLGIVLIIWVIQLVFSWLWLNSFSMGPFEWLWRSLTYKKSQPIRRK